MGLLRTCDYPEGIAHAGEIGVICTMQKETYRMDVCADHLHEVRQHMAKIGMKPTQVLVGHSQRGAYVSATGKTFTTKQARTWLQENGYEVTSVGRLTNEQLSAYRDAH